MGVEPMDKGGTHVSVPPLLPQGLTVRLLPATQAGEEVLDKIPSGARGLRGGSSCSPRLRECSPPQSQAQCAGGSARGNAGEEGFTEEEKAELGWKEKENPRRASETEKTREPHS